MPLSNAISAVQARTLYGLFLARVRRSPHSPAYREFNRNLAQWETFTWQQVAARVARWQAALTAEGLAPGERVAVSLRNGVDWVTFDLAAQGLALVTVPLYTDDRPDSVAHVLEDAGVALLLVQDERRWQRLAPALERAPLRRVLILEPGEASFTDPRVQRVEHWLPQEAGELAPPDHDPHRLATLIYTSGTTGRAKGVMLSHHNILSVVDAGLAAVEIRADDLFLSFLPLSHSYERTVGYYLPMATGATVAFARSVAQLGDDLASVRPTVLIAVPRIFERVHGRLTQQMRAASPAAQALMNFAIGTGWRRFKQSQGRAPWTPALLLWPLLDALVARKVRARLGGRLRLIVSGGAALAPEIAQLFLGLGLPLLQGYGLTETSPQVSVNRLDDNDPASVGPPLPGIEVHIGENSELLVHSPGNMLGYWNNPTATAAVLRDGWIHTGDQARMEHGHIVITGRIKDVLVLSNGEKVPPSELELAIAMDPLVDQVMLVGEGQPFLSALVVPNPEALAVLAAGLGLDAADPEHRQDRRIHQEFLQRIQRRLHAFPTWAKVRKLHLITEPWTVDNGLLTPSLKVKRNQVLLRHAAAIDALYAPPAPEKKAS